MKPRSRLQGNSINKDHIRDDTESKSFIAQFSGEFCEYGDVLSQSINGGHFLNISEISVSFKRSAGSKFREHTKFCTE